MELIFVCDVRWGSSVFSHWIVTCEILIMPVSKSGNFCFVTLIYTSFLYECNMGFF